jgi:hypothetical protein
MGRLATPTVLKLGLAIAGLLAFGWGIRTDDPRFRWWGIGFVGIAAALRVWKPRGPAQGGGGQA